MSFSSLLVRGLKSGYWAWNEEKNILEFTSWVAEKQKRKHKEVKTPSAINGLTYVTIKVDIKFKFKVSEAELHEFRHFLKERNKARKDHVITIDDVKVVAIFLCCEKLPSLFHKFFNLVKVNQLLRACIVYMEFYLQTCEFVIKTQSYLPAKTEENTTYYKIMKDLEDLRVLIGRFYADIILAELGIGESAKISRTDEILLFEYFLRVSTVVIWIALERKYFDTIKVEMGRIFRTEYFNDVCRVESTLVDDIKKKNYYILRGRLPGESSKDRKPNRLISISPVIQNFIEVSEPKLMQNGKADLDFIKDKRLKFLMEYIFEPEENARDAGVIIGILGCHRRLYDPLLYPCTKRNLKLLVTGSPMDISEERKKLRDMAIETSLREGEAPYLHYFDHLPPIPPAKS
ncbi:UNVERIFIED_CONTAM: hypothetical protein PYX00_006984 [Menopon gallinae]|uniref:Protein phosphatase 1 regulatory subunit 36 n=1 Tax=Menopon gallinae TaxID=328185 RepID=A0AAW2HH38_9NEOP